MRNIRLELAQEEATRALQHLSRARAQPNERDDLPRAAACLERAAALIRSDLKLLGVKHGDAKL